MAVVPISSQKPSPKDKTTGFYWAVIHSRAGQLLVKAPRPAFVVAMGDATTRRPARPSGAVEGRHPFPPSSRLAKSHEQKISPI